MFSSSFFFFAFSSSQPPWEKPEEEDEEEELGAPPEEALKLARADSSGSHRLEECRTRLAAVEAEQAALTADDEDARKSFASRAQALYQRLAESVSLRRAALESTMTRLHSALRAGGAEPADVASFKGAFSGPRSGRDAALAIAWFDSLGHTDGPLDAKTRRRLERAVKWVGCEFESLRQVISLQI